MKNGTTRNLKMKLTKLCAKCPKKLLMVTVDEKHPRVVRCHCQTNNESVNESFQNTVVTNVVMNNMALKKSDTKRRLRIWEFQKDACEFYSLMFDGTGDRHYAMNETDFQKLIATHVKNCPFYAEALVADLNGGDEE